MSYKKKVAGVLGRDPHPYHRHWHFTYYVDDNNGGQTSLDNADLEELPNKRQIKIVKGSVIMYIGAMDTSVTADLFLPTKVKRVIIKQYGKSDIFCFSEVDDQGNCLVFPGKELHAK